MSHKVLDGDGNAKYIHSLGTGTSNDPYLLINMQYERSLVDDGNVFQHSDRHSLANNNSFYYLLRTSTNHSELIGLYFSTTSAPLNVDVFEAGSVSANGTSEDLHNKNRIMYNTLPNTLLYWQPTVTADGTALIADIISGDKSIGSTTSIVDRMILKPSTNYLIKCQNVSGATASIGIKIRVSED